MENNNLSTTPDKVPREIIYCKGCIHSDKHREAGNGITEPPYIIGLACNFFEVFPMSDDDYCSRGVLRPI